MRTTLISLTSLTTLATLPALAPILAPLLALRNEVADYPSTIAKS